MGDVDVAHYSGLLSGGLIWVVFLLALGVGFTAKGVASRQRSIIGATDLRPRSVWGLPVLLSVAVVVFFAIAPFLVYGSGPSPSTRGIVMVVAGQIGYAMSMLLIGLLCAGVARLIGGRGLFTRSFIVGTGIGMALTFASATMNGHSWLLAP